MTFAQFKRMKPKYRRRLILACAILFAIFVAVVFTLAWVVSLIRTMLNTTTLEGFTAADVLQKEGMASIQEVIKQDNDANLLVLDSQVTITYDGPVAAGDTEAESATVQEVTVHLANILGKDATEYWELTATSKKATLRRTETRYENMNALTLRKVRFSLYYPALSRITSPLFVQYLKENEPVDIGGVYIFTDQFTDNLSPEYQSYISQGLDGVWVSKIGAPSPFNENFQPYTSCAPLVVSVQAVNQEKSTDRKTVLLPAEEKMVALMEAAPYAA